MIPHLAAGVYHDYIIYVGRAILIPSLGCRAESLISLFEFVHH